MFDPNWDKGCPACTRHVNALGDLSLLNDRETTFVLVSRAPLPKLEAYKAEKGWSFPWFSSFGSDFNYDFHVTNDEKIAPIEYNYRNKAELEARNPPNATEGEEHGLSVFFSLGADVFHTYSVYAGGTETLTDARSLLDVTPYGRQLRRLWFAVTRHPTAEWLAQQIVEAFPWGTAPTLRADMIGGLTELRIRAAPPEMARVGFR